MSEITFYGSSDDLVEVRGPVWREGKLYPDGEEFDVGTAGIGNSASIRAEFLLMDSEHKVANMLIYAIYDGCWSFAVSIAEEERPIPPWPVALSNEHSYSVALAVTVPDGVFAILKEDASEEMAAVAMLREKGYEITKP